MEIFHKAMQNDLAYLQTHINYINEVDNRGKSLLHYAVLGSAYDVIDYLLLQDIDVNIKDISGETALFDCARKGKLKIALNLISKYADVNIQNETHETLMHLACAKGDMDFIKLLIENNAFLNIKTKEGKLPIHYAILAGHDSLIKELMNEFNLSWDYLDDNQNSLLHYATKTSNYNLVLLMINYYLDVNALNAQFETPIFNAIKNGTKEIVLLLLKKGALVDIVNRRYETPLTVIKLYQKAVILELVENYKQTPEYRDMILTQSLRNAVLNRDHELLRKLVNENKVLKKDYLGYTAYDYAVKYHLSVCISILRPIKK